MPGFIRGLALPDREILASAVLDRRNAILLARASFADGAPAEVRAALGRRLRQSGQSLPVTTETHGGTPMATVTDQSEMNRLFTTFFETPTPGDTNAAVRRWHPAMDLVEADEHYIMRADLPGTDPKDVKIELEDRVLTISGERKSEQEERQQGFFRVERASGFFARSLTLPEGMDPASIEAAFDKGVLEVRIPKPEQRKPQRVEISVGGDGAEQPAIEGSESA